MRHFSHQLTKGFLGLLLLSLWVLPAAVHGQPVAFQLQGAAMELSFPGAPLTTAEAQELAQKFAGEATLTLVYDATATVPESGTAAFGYVSPSGPAFVLSVTNAQGTSTFSFSEYRLFLDNTSSVDTG